MNESSQFGALSWFSGRSGSGQQCADGAAALLKPAHQDYVWRELQDLKRKLSISPKKVRRILRDQGLLTGTKDDRS